MSDADRKRLKKIGAELKSARENLKDAKRSARSATTMIAKETAARSIKEVTEHLTRLKGEQGALMQRSAVA